MSKPREIWWGYVKAMIRRYPTLEQEYKALHEPSITSNISGMPGGRGVPSNPVEKVALRELPPTKQHELEAVQEAIKATRRMYGGEERIKLVNLVFWKRSHTLDGAAQELHLSERTARRWHTAFIYLVAEKYGLH